MILFKKLIGAACVFCLITTGVNAESINAFFHKKNRTIELSGELGNGCSDSRVIAVIKKDDGNELPTVSDSDYTSGKTGYIDDAVNILQVQSDGVGNYKFEDIKPGGNFGTVKIYVSAEKLAVPYTETLFVPADNDIEEFSDNISSGSESQIYALLERENSDPTFGADMRYYSKVSSLGRNKVAKYLYENIKNKKYNVSDKSEKAQLIDDDIFIYSYLAWLEETSTVQNADEIKQLLDIDHSEYSTLDKNRLSQLLDLEGKYKNSVFTYLKASKSDITDAILSKVASCDLSTPANLFDAIYISTINYKFKKVYGWRDAYTIMKEHIDVLADMNKDKLENNSGNQEMFNDTVSKTYGTIDELCSFVNSWQAKTSSTESGGNGSSSSSRSGGFGAGGINVTYDKPPINQQPQDNTINPQIFSDMGGFEWAKEAVETLYKEKIVSGYGDGTYNPSGNVSREEFLKMIVAALQIEIGETTETFDDVKSEDWFAPYVSAGISAGIIEGIGDNRFGVGQNISRQEMAVITYRALKYKNICEMPDAAEKIFNDDTEIDSWAKDAVNGLYELKVISGVGKNNFAPQNNMTRAEAAVLMFNIINAFNI